MKLPQLSELLKAQAVPCAAAQETDLQEDSGLSTTMLRPAGPEEPPLAVAEPNVLVPYADFLEHRRRRYGAAS